MPEIFFPDHWGLFGGATEPGESDEQGLRRELMEELTLDFQKVIFAISPASILISVFAAAG